MGSLDGAVEFYGVAPGTGRAPAPAGMRKHGFKLEWGHIAFNLKQQGGLFTLENMTEFYPARAADRPPVFNGFYFGSVTAGTEDGQDHRTYLELHDPDGNILRRFDEGPLHFELAGPGHLWGAFLGVSLHNVVFPAGVGEYAFVLFVDGQRVGATDYWFVPAPAPPQI